MKKPDVKLREIRAAAEGGDAHAQFNLAVMYRTVRGVARDLVEAMRWFRRAADQGLAAAQHNLAVAHYEGDGVAQDTAEAVCSMRKASIIWACSMSAVRA
ncbi:MAG: sel1 repeat family protein [Alphaproteobacteria bacterium]|nr:sel1 repeat family protein [Alphaproteobacteria bacterium]